MAKLRIKPKRGGAKKLKALQEALATSPDVLKVISRNCAEETLNFVKDRFREEKDPYGKRWKPKQIPDGRKVLSGKTSNLKGGWHVAKQSRRGFIIAPSVDYATFHQTGTRYMASRKMVPDSDNVPRELTRVWSEIATEALSEHFADI